MGNDAQALPASAAAVVVGAGPAGLAAAAELGRIGIEAVVLDSAGEVGSSWARHYDRLHLHTTRRLSSLPGMVIPRSNGRWVSRDDFRAYLRDYASSQRLDVRLAAWLLGLPLFAKTAAGRMAAFGTASATISTLNPSGAIRPLSFGSN